MRGAGIELSREQRTAEEELLNIWLQTITVKDDWYGLLWLSIFGDKQSLLKMIGMVWYGCQYLAANNHC